MSTLREVYDRIAPSRYNMRYWGRFRPELEALASRWGKGRLLNLGCGHGPDFLPFKEGFELYGVDFSSVMLKLAREYAAKQGFSARLVRADISLLPFAEASFDWAISIAAYHHLETLEARERAFSELARVLRPGGEAFITVWNRWRPQREMSSLGFWFNSKEAKVPWRSGGTTLYRYYYFFSYPELERLARKIGFHVGRSYGEASYHFPLKYFSRNICLLVKKAG